MGLRAGEKVVQKATGGTNPRKNEIAYCKRINKKTTGITYWCSLKGLIKSNSLIYLPCFL